MKSVNIEGVTISVENTDRYTTDDRMIFEWSINLDEVIYSAADLKSGCGADPSETEMLETFLSFLGASAESYRYDGMKGDNSNLFPEPVVKWAAEHEDEISYEQSNVQEELEIEQANERHADAVRQVAYAWHGGQGSALYAFASSGLCVEKAELFLEMEDCFALADEGEKEEIIKLMRFADCMPFDMRVDAWVAPWYDDWQGE
jgi:hypothetical protein